MTKKFTTDDFICRARAVHGDKYDYSKVKYVNNHTKVCIICPEHGEFYQSPIQHINNRQGCKSCGYKSFTKSTEWFVKEANSIHNYRYDYSKTEYVHTDKPVIVTCKDHGDFNITPHSHLRGNGCPICGKRVSYKKQKSAVGINDYDKILEGDARVAYGVWSDILERCYDEEKRYKHESYIGCTIEESWKRFSVFYKWWTENYIDGFCIDKDILVKGNRVYGPDTCCFVPHEINAFFIRGNKKRKTLPPGVYLFRNGKYVARISNGSRVNKHLGYYDNVEDAYLAFKAAKKERAVFLANKWCGKIPKAVYDKLINYEYDK